MYDVIIIGSGPAGLTAAIYTTRANLKTLVIAGAKWGGQLMLTTEVENFPGFPDGIQGPDLMLAMRKQAEKFGTEIVEANFVDGDFLKPPFTVKTAEKSFEGKSVIIATGADTKWLNVRGEQEKIGKGVSSCAPCDAAFFRNKNVIVVGGGDSAMEEALFLTKFATKVTVVHRKETLRASQIMQDKAKKNPKISFVFDTEVVEVLGDQKVSGVKLNSKLQLKTQNGFWTSQNDVILGSPLKGATPESEIMGKILTRNDQELTWEMPIDGIFVAVGHIPNSKIFKGIELDEKGFIKVQNHYHTNVEGVFVAGDVHDAEYKQAVTAAGFGCAAALEVEKWLRDQAA